MTENFMIGNRYTRLTVIAKTGERKGGHPLYLCRCICGAEKKVTGRSLRAGTTRSCGCLHRDITSSQYRKLRGPRSHNPLDDIDEDMVG